jgi:hypothetical protein
MSAAAFFRASNLEILDYPFEAALASALMLCDEACIVLRPSEDHSREIVYGAQAQYGAGRVKIREEAWTFDRGWQERVWDIQREMTTADWHLFIDADEVFHEDDIPAIRELMTRPDVWLMDFPFLHFYGTAGWKMVGSPVQRNTRLGRAAVGYRMRNWCSDKHPNHAACAMVIRLNGTEESAHSYNGAGMVHMDTPVYHYGWARDARALAVSQAKHRAWYADGGGLEDGRIPQVDPFDFNMLHRRTHRGIVRYDAAHPAVMGNWFQEHEKAWSLLNNSANPFRSDVAQFPEELALALRDLCAVRTFIETGTYRGDTARMMAATFDRVLTIEGVFDRYTITREEGGLPANVEMFFGNSGERLGELLTQAGEPSLVFLDAHWCARGVPAASDEYNQQTGYCALRQELAHIDPNAGHIVLIDDAHFFVHPPHNRGDVAAWPSMDEICAALPGYYMSLYHGVIVAVPNVHREKVRSWLMRQPENMEAYRQVRVR